MITAVSLIFAALMGRQYDAGRPLYRIPGYVGVLQPAPQVRRQVDAPLATAGGVLSCPQAAAKAARPAG